MRIWQAIMDAIGNVLNAKKLVSLVAEYHSSPREKLAYELATMACLKAQQALSLGRGNVIADITASKDVSYFTMRALRDMHKDVEANCQDLSPIEVRAYLALLAKTGGCNEYAALVYCYLKAIPNIEDTFDVINRAVYRYPDDEEQNHVFVQINIAEPDNPLSNFLICDAWGNCVSSPDSMTGKMLLINHKYLPLANGVPASEVYKKGIQLKGEVTQKDMFSYMGSKPGQDALLIQKIKDKVEFLMRTDRQVVQRDKTIYVEAPFPSLANVEILNPSDVNLTALQKQLAQQTSAIATASVPAAAAASLTDVFKHSHTVIHTSIAAKPASKSQVTVEEIEVEDHRSKSAYAHAADATAPKLGTASAAAASAPVHTTGDSDDSSDDDDSEDESDDNAAAPKQATASAATASASAGSAPAPAVKDSDGDESNNEAAPATPVMGSGPS